MRIDIWTYIEGRYNTRHVNVDVEKYYKENVAVCVCVYVYISELLNHYNVKYIPNNSKYIYIYLVLITTLNTRYSSSTCN